MEIQTEQSSKGVSPEKIKAMVAKVFLCFPTYGHQPEISETIGAYVAVLGQFSEAALRLSAQQIASGTAPGQNVQQRPSAAYWASVARKIDGQMDRVSRLPSSQLEGMIERYFRKEISWSPDILGPAPDRAGTFIPADLINRVKQKQEQAA